MSQELASITYASAYSFSMLAANGQIEIENTLNGINKILEELEVSQFNDIEFATDLIDFEVDGLSLGDRLLESVGNDSSFFDYYLVRLERILGRYKSLYKDTNLMCDEVSTQTCDSLPVKHPYTQTIDWPELNDSIHVSNYEGICTANSKNFGKGVGTRSGFLKKAKIVFEHLEFSEVFEDKLKTVKKGDYLDYIDVFAHGLNSLNQSFHKISNEPNQNNSDLEIISDVSSRFGRTLACTPQGKYKPRYNFKSRYGNENVNCEYHLKLNFDSNNRKLLHNDYNRLYFGLKYDSIIDKKRIMVGYVGEHYSKEVFEKEKLQRK